jgi:hypothetical protein
MDPPSRRRRAGALRPATWAATALVLLVGVIGVNRAADPEASPVAEPAISAQAQTTSTAPSARADDPTEALEQVRAQDAPAVAALAESWVAQLSARPATARAAADAAVLAGHDVLREEYPAAVLLRSTDWNYDGQFWITVVNQRFSTAEQANTWCDTHRFAPQDCFAKKLSRSGIVDGSAKYRS